MTCTMNTFPKLNTILSEANLISLPYVCGYLFSVLTYQREYVFLDLSLLTNVPVDNPSCYFLNLLPSSVSSVYWSLLCHAPVSCLLCLVSNAGGWRTPCSQKGILKELLSNSAFENIFFSFCRWSAVFYFL